MSANWGRTGEQLKSRVEDRIGKFRWVQDAAARQDTFDLELNAFETGCVMRWLERRWSRPADMARSHFLFHNNSLHLQLAQPSDSASGLMPISFETWIRRMTRLADQ